MSLERISVGEAGGGYSTEKDQRPKTGKVPEPTEGESGARSLKAESITCHMTFSFLSDRNLLWIHSNLI